ncbi:MmgE/PrpD family protein [Paracoccus laeviglucosivorans]|uniref:2-methylcitrate dehydratase PrpD n=1 Tax=Paracoccus laeviglucosivorans TaxID=1197861 RepID=A0A521FL20_9RHOB|nr:MmgE/PrpD family protein [Paracoccus laeviglucosivorans]SMO96816.1 2-methylcitrate dehydratase PrpD [Paracoccus laeviglucosivorans]
MTDPVALRFARQICAAREAPLPRRAMEVARSCILDTVGVTLAGMPEPCAQILLETPGIADGPGGALILGTSRRTSMLDAALVNGTAAHALDFDDFTGVLGGHQSVPVVPLLLALAEEHHSSGRDFIHAYAVGVEAEIRLSRAVNHHHYDKGWHPTATLGIFGGVAAASSLMGLDTDRTATALAIAASMASGLKANFGTMTKPLHVGLTNRSALLACLLAARDFTAAAGVFEHRQGFFEVFNGAGTYDEGRLFADWCAPWEIAHDDIGLKQFPCCGSTHPAIMMALKLRAEHALRPEDIAKVEVLPHARRLRHTDTPRPQTPLQAKFSVQYVVARALLDGTVRLKDFEGEAHLEPAVLALLDRTTARAHPDMADDAPQQWGAEVIVTRTDGAVLRARLDQMVGRGGDNPMTERELWSKFEDCASRSLTREQTAPLFERLMTLEGAKDMAQVVRQMQVSHLQRPQSRADQVSFAAASDQDVPETTWVP